MNKLARRYDLPAREFSEQTIAKCMSHSWPGNLRELEDFVKRYLITGQDQLNPTGPAPSLSHPVANNAQATNVSVPKVNIQVERVGPDLVIPLKTLLDTVKSHTEKNAIAAALQKTGWNRKAAARLLRVSYRTLLYKIERYKMRASDLEPELCAANAEIPVGNPIIRASKAV
jgi:DNA-binding NtrC family response regulator